MKTRSISMRGLLPFLLIGVFCGQCNALELGEKIIESAAVVGVQLQLIDSNGVCTLIHKENGATTRLALVPQPPCFFLRSGVVGQTTPQHFAYPKVGVKATLIVAGTLISDERRKKHGIVPDHLCGGVIQGILITKNKIAASADVLSSGIACRDSGRDEKDFWFFAHPNAYKN